jgi:hypothetical protein
VFIGVSGLRACGEGTDCDRSASLDCLNTDFCLTFLSDGFLSSPRSSVDVSCLRVVVRSVERRSE